MRRKWTTFWCQNRPLFDHFHENRVFWPFWHFFELSGPRVAKTSSKSGQNKPEKTSKYDIFRGPKSGPQGVPKITKKWSFAKTPSQTPWAVQKLLGREINKNPVFDDFWPKP